VHLPRALLARSQSALAITDFDRKPDVLYAARRRAIEETLGLDASPRMIIQTNPPEHSLIANNGSIDRQEWSRTW